MTTRNRAWFHHFALNLGVALSCMVYMWWPPHWHHSEEEVGDLSQGSFREWFRRGWE